MHRLLIATSLMFVACASRPAKEPTTVARGHMTREGPHAEERRITHPEPGMTCETSTPTGSLYERRKCRSDIERQQDRDYLQNAIMDPASRGAATAPS